MSDKDTIDQVRNKIANTLAYIMVFYGKGFLYKAVDEVLDIIDNNYLRENNESGRDTDHLSERMG